MILIYLICSLFQKRFIDIFDFYELYIFGNKWIRTGLISLFSICIGMYVALASVQPEKSSFLLPVSIFFIGCVLALIINERPFEPIVRTVEVIKEKILFYPSPFDGSCEVVYIMRRSDGVFKFGRTNHLKTRIAMHRLDYKMNFNVIASWVVFQSDRYERLALDMTKKYTYREGNRRELRQMSESELSNFILEFTNQIQKDWNQ